MDSIRMRHSLALMGSLIVVFLVTAAPAQPKQDCLITIHSDGTCDAAGLHVRCSVIGPRLRQAGISTDAHIRFHASGANYALVSATVQSVTRAGFTTMKVGFITEPVH